MIEINRPVEALDLHLSYWSHAGTDDHRRAVYSHMLAKMAIGVEGLISLGVDYEDAVNDPEIHEGVREMCDALVSDEGALANEATTIFVSPDVSIVTRDIGGAMPPDLLHEEDLPIEKGFAILSIPWMMRWDDETEVPIRAIAWERIDWIPPDQRIIGGEMTVDEHAPEKRSGAHFFVYTDKEHDPFGIDTHSPLGLLEHWVWPFDTWWRDLPEDEVREEEDGSFRLPRTDEVPEEIGLVRRQLLTLWRFMNEEVTRTERPRLPRAASRRWERAHKADMPNDGCLVSIHLRRYSQQPPKATVEEEEREAREVWWSHRWWVRGHHRFCKKCGIDHPKHKHEWVRPHLKPNDDTLPIVIKEKLVSVDR